MSASSSIVDALIVGGGPAGLSAALAFARQNQTAVVFDNGQYRNAAADYMHLIPGWDHKPPSDFRAAARSQMTDSYDVIRILEDTNVATAQKTEQGIFQLSDEAGRTWSGKKLILATGVEDVMLDIPGYAELWGKAIFHCLYCKGYEQRGASAGVLAVGPLGNVNTALHIARQETALSKRVTLYCNGNDSLAAEIVAGFGTATNMKTDTRKVKELAAGIGGKGIVIRFDDGSEAVEDYLAHQPPTRPRGNLADQLGLEKAPNGEIKVSSPFQQASLRGVFAAGDNGAMLKNVPNAVFSGHVAGQMASTQLLADLNGQKSLFPL
ncbi:Thioredoxin reductase tcpT [Metarhizium anisopliae]